MGSVSVTVVNPTPGGGTSNAVSFTVGNPVPVIVALQPNRATIGGQAFTLTLTGTGFQPATIVQWNGVALTTTYGSDTSVSAQVPAADLAGSTGQVPVTAVNPTPDGGSSAPASFAVVGPATYVQALNANALDIAWDSAHDKIYASTPATQNSAAGIVVIDPTTGQMGLPISEGEGPDPLAVLSDGSFLYAGLDGTGQVVRLSLPDLSIDASYHPSLASCATSFQPTAFRLEAAPGPSNKVAVLAVEEDIDAEGRITTGSNVVVLNNSLNIGTCENPDFTNPPTGMSFGADETTISVVRFGQLDIAGVTSTNGGLYEDHTYNDLSQNSLNVHYAKSNGLYYLDEGEVVDPSNGNVVQIFDLAPIFNEVRGNTLCLPDDDLGVVFFVGQTGSQIPSRTGVTISAFDMKSGRKLGSLVVPNTSGYPKKLIRWGKSGLAVLTTATPFSLDEVVGGPVYLVDGNFINSSIVPDSATGDVVYSTPNLISITPQSAVAGSNAVTLTISGSNLDAGSTATWNSQPLSTTFVSSTKLEASVPQNLLSAPGNEVIRVSDTTSGLTSPNSQIFTVLPSNLGSTSILPVNLASLNIAWEPKSAQLIATVWSMDTQNPDTVAMIDPTTGAITRAAPVGSDPKAIAISDDGTYVYAGFEQLASVARLSLPNLDSPFRWDLPSDKGFGPLSANDIEVAPGEPGAVAVDFATSYTPAALDGLTVYDNGVARPVSPGGFEGEDWLQWGADSSTLYAADLSGGKLTQFSVDSSGLTSIGFFDGQINGFVPTQTGMHFDAKTGLMYFESGNVYDPNTGRLAGTYGELGLIAVDSALDRVFILSQNSNGNYAIDSFDQLKFSKVGTLSLPQLVGQPAGLVRWGANGLAFVTLNVTVGKSTTDLPPGMLYVINDSNFVSGAARPNTGPTVAQPATSPEQR